MLKFTQSSEDINSNGGFSFIGRLLDSNKAMELWDRLLPAKHNSLYTTSTVVKCAVGLMAAGEPDYADIEKFRHDSLFQMLAGGAVPSQETFRQRLDALGEKDWGPLVDACVASQLARAKPTPLRFDGMSLVPLDIDVSVFEDAAPRKEGVAMSYHGVTGYAPILCYAGREGYLVAAELRPGSQHSENGAVAFLERAVKIMEAAGYKASELLVRADSGHDAADFVRKLEELGVKYLVKRNLRREDPVQILDSVRSYERPSRPRPGKTVYRGVRSDRAPAGMDGYKGFMVVEAVERTTLAGDPQRLLIPEVEAACWWTNLPSSARRCVRLYHDHGTSEQFHSELKGDMGLELLPSGSLKTNALVLGLAAVAFNCLRFIGQSALEREPAPADEKKRLARHRLRTVILDYVKVGCKVASHAGRTILKFGRNCFNFFIMKEIYAIC